jgi:hypothetical protein
MQNIHILPTDKSSRLTIMEGKLLLSNSVSWESKSIDWEYGDGINQHIYITSDDEIKEGDWIYNEEREPSVIQCIGKGSLRGWRKIILTTDQDLIADGVQAIDDEFLEWFVKNPSCEEVEIEEICPLTCCIQKEGKTKMNNGCMERNRCLIYKTIIPQEEPKQELERGITITHVGKQETLEEAAKDFIENTMKYSFNSLETKTFANRLLKSVEFGAKWQAERMYSEEEVEKIAKDAYEMGRKNILIGVFNKWFKQFKKK